jgi:hypothetical protein
MDWFSDSYDKSPQLYTFLFFTIDIYTAVPGFIYTV